MKNSENTQLDQLLKDQLAEGSAKVPDFVWDRIEEELFPEKKRRFFFWWWLFGGFCVLLVSCLALFFHYSSEHSQNFDRAQKQIVQQQISKQNTSDSKVELSGKSSVQVKTKPEINSSTTSKPKMDVSQKPVYASSKNVSWSSVDKTSKSKTSRSSKTSNSTLANSTHGSTSLETGNVTDSKNAPSTNDKSPSQPESGNEAIKSDSSQEKTPEIAEISTKTDSVDYSRIYELLQHRFPANVVSKELSRFSIGVYGGPSFYDIAVFKDYFTSGQLSNRTFTSSGFEAGFNARFNLGNRFTIYSGLDFNRKQSQFNYNVAITQTDYFTNVVNDNKIPLANIVDNGLNSCFLAKGVMSKYSISSTLLSIGTTYEFWKSGRFSAAADLRFSFNIQSAMKLSEITVIDIQQPESERFSYFQPGLGVLFDYQLNRRISVGLSPMFSKQFYTKESFSKKVNELVVPVSLRIRI